MLPGGFVGVDVFFVISGYVITSIITNELDSGTFNISSFYARRARRIIPALLAMTVATTALAWIWLLPNDMKDFGASLITAPLFISNFLFWLNAGYFERASELKPLLHTWSLAVEAQYYITFPLLLIALRKLSKKSISYILLALIIGTLILSEITLQHTPETSFYMLHTRAWELMIGAVIALNHSIQYLCHRKFHNALSACGLLMILSSVIFLNKHFAFPGLYALIPTIGAALIIAFSTKQTYTYRLLSSKALVGIGLISYSLYLWHYPIFTFARHRFIEEPSAYVFLVLIGIAFILSYISWKYIETPCRDRNKISALKIFTPIYLCTIILILFGAATHINGGYTHRFSQDVLTASTPTNPFLARCDTSTNKKSGVTCIIGDISVTPDTALVGDSHATHLAKALDEELLALGKSALIYSQNNCPPMLGLDTNNPFRTLYCKEFMQWTMDELRHNTQIQNVILAAQWPFYANGSNTALQYTNILYYDSSSINRDVHENIQTITRGLERTKNMLTTANKKVLIIKSVPEYDVLLPNYVGKSLLFNSSNTLSEAHTITLQKYEARNKNAEDIFNAVNLTEWAQILETYDIICGTTECRYLDDANNILYIDGDHLSYHGAKLITPHIIKKIFDG